MRETNGLRGLKVRVAGQDRVAARARLPHERGLERQQRALDGANGVFDVQPRVGCDQVVSAAAGAQLARDRTGFAVQPGLDPGVDILGDGAPRPVSVPFDQAPDLLEAAREPARLGGAQHADAAQLANVREVDAQVVEDQAVVHRERFRKLFEVRVAPSAREPTSPELHRFLPRAVCVFFSAASFTGSPSRLIKPSASFWS